MNEPIRAVIGPFFLLFHLFLASKKSNLLFFTYNRAVLGNQSRR